jgi:hypothetical protein
MSWSSLFVALLVAHLAGDFLLQTDFQAGRKAGGLGRDPVARRALWTHGLTYTLCFVPVLAWVADARSIPAAVALAAGILLPHVAVDHGALVRWWTAHVKHAVDLPPYVTMATDQSFHVVALLAAALLVAHWH